MIIDELLEKLDLKYEDLNSAERETLHSWMEALNKNTLSLPMVRTYIASMREAVETELTTMDINKKKDTFLKARLRNYMLLEAFLSTPERAKTVIERSLASFASRVRKGA